MKIQIFVMAAGMAGILITCPGCAKDFENQPSIETAVWTSSQPAASDSIEGKLLAKGKTWTKISGDIVVGSYVEDILEQRLDQPVGRGAIGKVVALGKDENDRTYAKVDFGRHYVVGIYESELSLVSIE